jgi:transposase
MKVHANAPLGPKGRLTMVVRVLERGWSLAAAAEAAGVSERTCSKWLARYRAEGEFGRLDRSSAPRSLPHRTPQELVEVIVLLRRLRMTGAEIAWCLAMAASTVSAVLARVGLGKLSRLEPRVCPMKCVWSG